MRLQKHKIYNVPVSDSGAQKNGDKLRLQPRVRFLRGWHAVAHTKQEASFKVQQENIVRLSPFYRRFLFGCPSGLSQALGSFVLHTLSRVFM